MVVNSAESSQGRPKMRGDSHIMLCDIVRL